MYILIAYHKYVYPSLGGVNLFFFRVSQEAHTILACHGRLFWFLIPSNHLACVSQAALESIGWALTLALVVIRWHPHPTPSSSSTEVSFSTEGFPMTLWGSLSGLRNLRPPAGLWESAFLVFLTLWIRFSSTQCFLLSRQETHTRVT